MNTFTCPHDLQIQIQTAYAASGNVLGWRLLMSPATALEGADVAFIGLNPGGSAQPAEHAEFAPEAGSAYACESWAGYAPGRNPLQREVLLLFERIGVQPETVLAGNLIPFRSQNWGKLANRKEALHFGCGLWRDILARAGCKLVITMGAIVTDTFRPMLGCRELTAYPLGWGTVKGVRGEFRGGTLIGLPHLSRYRVISRGKSAEPLAQLFHGYWRN